MVRGASVLITRVVSPLGFFWRSSASVGFTSRGQLAKIVTATLGGHRTAFAAKDGRCW